MEEDHNATFNDISPVLKYNDIKKNNLVTINNLKNLHAQLLELANKVYPKKVPLIERIKNKYIDPFISSNYSKIIFFSGYCMNLGVLLAETYEEIYEEYFKIIAFFDFISYLIILLITSCRYIIYRSQYWTYFWNYICIGCLIVTPLYYIVLIFFNNHEDLLLTLKILRLASIFRIINLYHPTRIIFHSLIKSILNISLITYLVLIFIILTAFLANELFEETEKSIKMSMYTIFIILSQSGWLPSYRKVCNEYPIASKIFFISVGFFGSFVLINLFTGIALVSMNKAKRKQEKIKETKNLEKTNKIERTKTLNKLLARKKSLERFEQFGHINLKDLQKANKELELRLKKLNILYQDLNSITEDVFEVSHDEYEKIERAASMNKSSESF